jgi:hypothetical protein
MEERRDWRKDKTERSRPLDLSDPHLRETYRLFPSPDPYFIRVLDRFRRDYERRDPPEPAPEGHVYTSQLPRHQRLRMMRENPDEFYAGLPPFAKKYLEQTCILAGFDGDLDSLSDGLISVFVRNGSRIP